MTAYWPDGVVLVDSVPFTHASTFELHEVQTDQWQLRAVKNNLYLTAENGGGQECMANRPSASGWETFHVTFITDSEVKLQAFDGHWLSIDESNSSRLVATATSAEMAEKFTVESLPQHKAVNLGSWFVPEKWYEDASLYLRHVILIHSLRH